MLQLAPGGVVLGVLPSLAGCGWAIVRLLADAEAVESFGVLRTRTAYGTSETGGGDINRRSRTIARLLRVVAARETLAAIVCRVADPKGDVLDARVYGVLMALSVELDVPLLEVNGAEVRAARDATRAWLDDEDPAWPDELADDEIGVALHGRAIDAVSVVRVASGRHASLEARISPAAPTREARAQGEA